MTKRLFVFDTNTLISATLLKNSIPRKALLKAFEIGILCISNDTLNELIAVIFRKKFDKYFLNDNERLWIIEKLETNSKTFKPTISITDCRDPKDNKFLELAVTAKSNFIITGDDDLLVLNPFRGISILSASNFLKEF